MAAAMVNSPTSLPSPSGFSISIHDRFCPTTIPKTRISFTNLNPRSNKSIRFPCISCCLNSITEASTKSSSPDEASTLPMELPPVKKKRRVFRRQQPGEAEGIAEEMRFVAMRLRTTKVKVNSGRPNENYDNSEMRDYGSSISDGEIDGAVDDDDETNNENPDDEGTWEPTLEGFMKYLVDSKHVFSTIERLVDESQDVSFAYFRKTGLERNESFTKDLEWFSQRNVTKIPDPQDLTKKYVKYLEELAEENTPLFFCHLYSIYFSHIVGGQVIAKKVSEKILEGRELEICKWPSDPKELLKRLREKLNALGQHWSRDEKTQCLKTTNKAFISMGTIIRLICA